MRYWRTPLDAETNLRHVGEVYILEDRCKGCEWCVEYCPLDVLEMSSSFNRKGYHPPEVVKHGECVNCNLCEMICPEFAIFSAATEISQTAAAGSPSEPTENASDNLEASS